VGLGGGKEGSRYFLLLKPLIMQLSPVSTGENYIMRSFVIAFPSVIIFVCFFVFGTTAPSVPWPPHSRGFWITHNVPQSVGILWTSDQLVTETSNKIRNTHERHQCPWWDSNPQSQQASGRRPMP
jgi:hypothetical protein